MKKAEFIKKFSKIEYTFEDEFKAEFNSPELIWEALKKQLTLTDDNELDCPYEFTSRCTMGRCGCKPKAS